MVPGRLVKGDRMDDKQTNKLIGYAVVAIIAYYLLQMIVPFLIWGVMGMVAWRIYQEHNKHRH
jgi:predicted negative regulator of RcsB-dependent stress response